MLIKKLIYCDFFHFHNWRLFKEKKEKTILPNKTILFPMFPGKWMLECKRCKSIRRLRKENKKWGWSKKIHG